MADFNEQNKKCIMCGFVPLTQSLYMHITVYIPLVCCNEPVLLNRYKKYLSADEERPNQNTNC